MSKANSRATTTTLAFELTRRSTVGALLASVVLIGPASAVCMDDPIFKMIEEHRAVSKAFRDALTEQSDMEDATLFRRSRPRVQLGVTEDVTMTIGKETVAVPGGPYFASERDSIAAIEDITRREQLLAEWDRQVAEAANPALDAIRERTDQLSGAEDEATIALLTTPPTTLAGATALLRYIANNHEDDYLMTNCGEAGNGYDALVASLIMVIAPLVPQ